MRLIFLCFPWILINACRGRGWTEKRARETIRDRPALSTACHSTGQHPATEVLTPLFQERLGHPWMSQRRPSLHKWTQSLFSPKNKGCIDISHEGLCWWHVIPLSWHEWTFWTAYETNIHHNIWLRSCRRFQVPWLNLPTFFGLTDVFSHRGGWVAWWVSGLVLRRIKKFDLMPWNVDIPENWLKQGSRIPKFRPWRQQWVLHRPSPFQLSLMRYPIERVDGNRFECPRIEWEKFRLSVLTRQE